MRFILIRTLVFLLPIMALLGVLEYIQWELPHDYKRKRELLEEGLEEWETLVLGSSHAYLGVNPEYLEGKAFNLAYTAQTFAFDLFLLEKYIDQMPSLKRIIYPVSYPSYGSEAHLFDGIYDKTYYFKHFYGSELYTHWYEPENYSLLALFTVKKSVDRTLRYYQGKDSLVEFNEDGWFFWNDSLTTKELYANGKQSSTYHNHFYQEDLHEKNLAKLAAIIEICQKHGVDVWLISTPMHESYRENMKAERYRFMVESTDSLASTYGISYLNLTSDDRFGKHDFMDANHLDKEGARKFTLMLRDTMEQSRPYLSVEVD